MSSIVEVHPDEQLLKPEMDPPVGAVNKEAAHVKDVPVVADLMAYPTAALLQMVVVGALFTVGIGST